MSSKFLYFCSFFFLKNEKPH
uniref:Uncharacterized protein n=1 Tax=Rhizophora mucronata TaxID=61149 RepID=A0A2P2R2Z4_RHIMU